MTSGTRDIASCGSLMWKTRDGRLLKWSQMSTTHLRNCATHLTRRAEESIDIIAGAMAHLRGEEALDSAGYAFDRACDRRIEVEDAAEALRRYAQYREERGETAPLT